MKALPPRLECLPSNTPPITSKTKPRASSTITTETSPSTNSPARKHPCLRHPAPPRPLAQVQAIPRIRHGPQTLPARPPPAVRNLIQKQGPDIRLVDFTTATGLNEKVVTRAFGTWRNFRTQAGLTPNPAIRKRIPDEAFFADLLRVSLKLDRICTPQDYDIHGESDLDHLEAHFGSSGPAMEGCRTFSSTSCSRIPPINRSTTSSTFGSPRSPNTNAAPASSISSASSNAKPRPDPFHLSTAQPTILLFRSVTCSPVTWGTLWVPFCGAAAPPDPVVVRCNPITTASLSAHRATGT